MSAALTRAVMEIEAHVAAGGWDQPPRLYALVAGDDLAAAEPELAAALGIGVTAGALASVEQEDLPEGDVETLLARIAWPPEVLGTAIVLERLMLPPAAEEVLPDDPAEAAEWVATHPDRQEVRIAVGVMRDGSRECALRRRTADADTDVLSGPDLVPGLAEALVATLQD